jgi:hypothetical protein
LPLARLQADGAAVLTWRERCPGPGWHLCGSLDRLPMVRTCASGMWGTSGTPSLRASGPASGPRRRRGARSNVSPRRRRRFSAGADAVRGSRPGGMAAAGAPRLGLLLCVLTALAANASTTGALSKPHHRYQARIVWLLPLGAALAFRPGSVRQASPCLRTPSPLLRPPGPPREVTLRTPA